MESNSNEDLMRNLVMKTYGSCSDNRTWSLKDEDRAGSILDAVRNFSVKILYNQGGDGPSSSKEPFTRDDFLKMSKEELISEILKLSKKMKEKSNETIKLERQFDQQNKDYNDLKKQYEELKAKLDKDKDKDVIPDLATLLNERDELLKEVGKLKEGGGGNTDEEVTQLKGENTALKSMIEQLQSKLKLAKRHSQTDENVELNTYKCKCDILEKNLNDMKAIGLKEIKFLEHQLKCKCKQLDHAEEVISEYEKDIMYYLKCIDVTRLELIDELELEVGQLQDEVVRLFIEKEENSPQSLIDPLNDRIKALEGIVANLTNTNSLLENSLKDSLNQTQNENDLKSRLEKDVAILREELVRLEKAEVKQKEVFKNLEKKLKEQDQQIADLNKQLKKIQDLESKIRSELESTNQKLKQSEIEHKSLSKQINELIAKEKHAENEIKKLENEKSKLQSNVAALNDEINKLKTKLAEALEENKMQNKQLDDTKKLMTDIEVERNRNQKLEKELEKELQKCQGKLKNDMEEATNKIKELKKHLDKADKDLRDERQANETLQDRITASRKEIEKLKEEIAKLSKNVIDNKELDRMIEQDKDLMKEAKEEVQCITNERNLLAKENESLKERLDKLMNQCQCCQKKLAEITIENNKLKSSKGIEDNVDEIIDQLVIKSQMSCNELSASTKPNEILEATLKQMGQCGSITELNNDGLLIIGDDCASVDSDQCTVVKSDYKSSGILKKSGSDDSGIFCKCLKCIQHSNMDEIQYERKVVRYEEKLNKVKMELELFERMIVAQNKGQYSHKNRPYSRPSNTKTVMTNQRKSKFDGYRIILPSKPFK